MVEERQCLALTAKGERCRGRALPESEFCMVHQSTAPIEEDALKDNFEELDATVQAGASDIREIKERLGDLTATLFAVGENLKSIFLKNQGNVEAQQDEFRKALEVIMAYYTMDEEVVRLVSTAASERGISYGELLSSYVLERSTWEKGVGCTLIRADLWKEAVSLAHGRGISPRDVIEAAVLAQLQADAL